MRRRTRKLLVQLMLFGGVLCLVLFLNAPSSTPPTLAWTRIRYRPRPDPPPPTSRGACPGLADANKLGKPALVVARVHADGDAGWLKTLEAQYHLCVYTADAPAEDPGHDYLQTPANRGHEAMAYLTFLIDNYAQIPAAGAVFVHGSRWAWHNDAPDYDNAALLAALNVSAALHPSGYHNLRCDWSAGTCPPSTPPQRSLETSLQAVLQPWGARAVSDKALPDALATLFGGGGVDGSLQVLLGRSDTLRAQCCAQFVVSRDRVWQHSREEYIALRSWLLTAAPRDDRISGRILSYLWHILFLRPGTEGEAAGSGGIHLQALNRAACPRADECYCRLYGRCNLANCVSPGACYGQYRVPKDYRLPDDWAASHVE
ncbi:hypothetical protein ASPZODRAFT_76604 [Penicilliopsis zonata CBS 506.65]|uniref:Uncharacterized protein n=1 Tax=Penicilliopsis zonata CBS 506.65 TaxID=1073090 RepID=A0A1L9S5U8_9EURO|nr:hypothetical protein ASPZODRAFT_76604 [Penicilliopsis zonata CBS 506.65]OJJ42532.1 hypothetical protein ASPZODRAFT_76604 [Penicilliopsis zonata CBS 506.65]